METGERKETEGEENRHFSTPLTSSFEPKRIEEEVRARWGRIEIRTKVSKARSSGVAVGFVEGPPTLNGEPHIGHIRGRILKDIWYRFNTLKGLNVVFRAGWDTQGLPVELQAEKELGLKGSKVENLQAVGVEALVEACKRLVMEYGEKWRTSDRLLGMSFDYERAYWTFRDEYIEREWEYLRRAWETGLLGEGYRVVAYCPGCQTSLSHAEVSQGYEKLEDPSLYFKMKLVDEDAYLIIWTTMPFTVVTDENVAVKPESEYVYVKVEGETWIAAKERVAALLAEVGVTDYEVVRGVRGANLEGKKYLHPLMKYVPGLEALASHPQVHTVLAETFVDTTTGSGVVHLAPANGEVDFEAAQKRGIPIFNPIDERLFFTSEAGVFERLFVRDADEKVMRLLREEGCLLKAGRVVHDYPTCWRSHHRLVWVARREYFYWVDRLGEKAVEAAERVEYFYEAPANRFLAIIREKVPWCISRERIWGTPLPIWSCSKCRHQNALFTRQAIVERATVLPDGPNFELHRPWIDRVVVACERCGAPAHRVGFVLDTWHNSGASPYASFTDEEYDKLVPVPFLSEGIDQTRGWAYTLLIENILLSGKPQAPYRAFLFQGHVLDENGNKMSKSLGNIVEGLEVLTKESVDVLRFYLTWKSAPIESLNYSASELRARPFQVLNTLFHLHVYLQQNGRYDGFVESDHSLVWAKGLGVLKAQDRWLLSKLAGVVETVTKGFETCRHHEACRALETFIIEDVSQIYIPFVRSELWDDSPRTLDRRLSIYATLAHTLRTVDIVLHPISPYLTEYLYHTYLTPSGETILTDDWPSPQEFPRAAEVESEFAVLQELVSLSNSARMKAKLKRRWPLRRAVIYGTGEALRKIGSHLELVKEQMNVAELALAPTFRDMPLKVLLVPRYDLLGPRLKREVPEVVEQLAQMDAWRVQEELSTVGSVSLDLGGKNVRIAREEVEVRFEPLEGYTYAEKGGLMVALQAARDRELVSAGAVRDLARRLQALRKERGFNPTEILEVAYVAGLDEEWLDLLRQKTDELAFLVRVREIGLRKTSDLRVDWSDAAIDGRDVKLYVGRKS